MVWAFAGVRSLYDDGSDRPEDVTRDYHLVLDEGFRAAPLLTVYGGKITTYRKLAEAALAKLYAFLRRPAGLDRACAAAGRRFSGRRLDAQVAQARRTWPFLTSDHARRLVRAYGTRIDRILGEAASMADLGVVSAPT